MGKYPEKDTIIILKDLITFLKNFSNLHVDSLRGLPPVLAVLADCSPAGPLAALAVIVCVNS